MLIRPSDPLPLVDLKPFDLIPLSLIFSLQVKAVQGFSGKAFKEESGFNLTETFKKNLFQRQKQVDLVICER
jgi:hypothetical protein